MKWPSILNSIEGGESWFEKRECLAQGSSLNMHPSWPHSCLECGKGKWFFLEQKWRENNKKTIPLSGFCRFFAVFGFFFSPIFVYFCLFFLWGAGVGHGENAATASGARIELENQIEGIERIDAAAVWRLVTGGCAGCACTACTACTWSARTVL